MLYRLARDVSSCKLELSVGREPRAVWIASEMSGMASVWRSCHWRTDLAHHKTSSDSKSRRTLQWRWLVCLRCCWNLGESVRSHPPQTGRQHFHKYVAWFLLACLLMFIIFPCCFSKGAVKFGHHDGMMKFFEKYREIVNGIAKNDEYTLTLSDGRSLSIRDHEYPLDDLYCWVNGWYSLPRASVIQNYSYLEEVSDRSCKNLEQIPGCAQGDFLWVSLWVLTQLKYSFKRVHSFF